ncbi:MAG: 4-phosphoerythronate dehydrogenase [Bacteroidota bacterium]
MKIVADENIPQVKEAFENFGEVLLANGREISNDHLKNADVLLTRSITNVNEELLENTKIKFVATATIGVDHIDLDYLNYRNIEFADAKGCNAYSVAEYVICSIINIYNNKNILLDNKKIGVVGYGNIGTKISTFAEAIGLNVLINDPPLERISTSKIFHDLEDALKSDIVTLHVPLNKSGIDKTYHLIDSEKIHLIKENTLLINTSRGPVVDNFVLKDRLEKQNDITTTLDVWENEPNIDADLLSKVNIGTAHIAGYSLEGKLNGTLLIYEKFCDYFGFNPTWQPNYPTLENDLIAVNTNDSIEKILNDTLSKVYNVEGDSTMLKGCSKLDDELRGKCFDNLRKSYSVRREFNNYTIKLNKRDNKLKEIFEALRFKVT